MTVKTVLAYLPSEELGEPVLNGAVALAKAHGAHVIGLHLEAAYYPAYGEVAIAMPPDVIEQMRKPLRERSKKLEEGFKARMADEKISSEWRSGSTEYSSLPARIIEDAVSADLVLCPQVEPSSVDVTTLDLPERLILEGGRPVLILPLEHASSDEGCRGYHHPDARKRCRRPARRRGTRGSPSRQSGPPRSPREARSRRHRKPVRKRLPPHAPE